MTEEAIFAEAVAINDPAARARFLDRACGGDAEMRQQVDELSSSLAIGLRLRLAIHAQGKLSSSGLHRPSNKAKGQEILSFPAKATPYPCCASAAAKSY